MLAMQYTIQLPRDYDMNLIRARVQERKPLFDRLPGLVHKAYLANFDEKVYAPFYIWNDMNKLRNFLVDDLFHGVTAAFSRPRVRTWAMLNMHRGTHFDMPTYAIRETDIIPPDANLDHWLESEEEKQHEVMQAEGLYMHVLGLDPDRWEVMRYSLWANEGDAPEPESDSFQTYTVLHV